MQPRSQLSAEPQPERLFNFCCSNVVLSAHLTLTSGQKYPLPERAGEHPPVGVSVCAVLGPASPPPLFVFRLLK